MRLDNLRVVFMGTPLFAKRSLEKLIDNCNVVLVVCQADKKKDRKGNTLYLETKQLALENNIPVFQPECLKDDYQAIIDAKPDIIVTCAYGQFIPDVILQLPKYGCINVHGSLLPKLRGGAPIHWAIINGEDITGVTIMDMVLEMDAGDIISQRSIEIGENMILDELYDKMSFLGADLLIETLPSIIDGTASRVKQDASKVTFGFNVLKKDTSIDFNKSGSEIRNLVRGLNSVPGAYCFLENKRLKIYEVIVLEKYKGSNYGKIVRIDKDGIVCTCGDSLLKIVDLAVEGKKRCRASDYINGIDKNKILGKVFVSE